MSKGVNKVILVGHLGADPEFKQSDGGIARALLSVATSHSVKEGEGWRDETDWHRVVLFSRLAEVARDYLRKGSQVYIEGRLQTRKWQDQQTGQDRYITEVVGQELQMLGPKNQGENGGAGNYDNRPTVNQPLPTPVAPPPAPPPPQYTRQPAPPPPVAPAPKTYDDIPF